VAHQGDRTHRQEYDLTRSSVVVDAGGFEGQWASDIFSRYQCPIDVFEPIPKFAEQIAHRFAHNPSIRVHDFGLGDRSGTMRISVTGDASSILRPSANSIDVQIKSFSDWIKSSEIANIDLFKINIEGAEFALLRHLIETGFILQIRDLQVQFHDFV
jgi:FkbM family methyltransferase